MATRIRHKRSAVAGKQPIVSQLNSGELAINTADGKVYLLRDDNTVQDITKRVFEGNTSLTVDDLSDSTSAAITAVVNNDSKMSITDNGIDINDDVRLSNANTLTFRELVASGTDGVSLKAPDTLDAGYNLTLPPITGTIGQLLKTDGAGNLSFTDPDIFGGNVVYVSAEQGDDINDGQSAPVKTIKRACQIASGLVYNADGTTSNVRVNVKVAVGDYTETNPLIVPDNTVIKGDGLRGCIIRPANANQDMLRVRNACYFGEITFRDGVDDNQVPLITADYAVAFDDPFDTTVDRTGYTRMPTTRPFITTSPYIQNCSILSFLGMNGAKIDGSKIQSPNIGFIPIEQENPVVGAIPEQGKSMVANAFTILSFGGTAWRLTNDAYAQIVSCFEIFLLNGVYTQSGGYCSITNSATNFGLYALRSSGYSPKAFEFDRAYATGTGAFEGLQTISIVGINRATPVEEFVLRFREGDYKTAFERLTRNKAAIATSTANWIANEVATASSSIWAGYVYDAAKCERDVSLLVDAVRWDAAFDTNYRSVSHAIKYFNGRFNSSKFEAQRLQHVESFTQAKSFTTNISQNGTFDSRAAALWDEIIDIVKNSGTYSAAAGTTYNPADGALVLTIGAHDLTVGTQVLIAPNSLTFTCATDGNSAQKTYPRAVAGDGGTDPAYQTPVTITAVAATTITVNVGVSVDTSAHTFVSAVANSIEVSGVGVFEDPTDYNTSYLPGYGNARAQIVANKKFIQKEITYWIAAQVAAEISPFTSTYTYNEAKCEEDVGLILDALVYDLTYGGNLQTFDAAIQYFVGTTSQLASGQKSTTMAAYVRLKEVLGQVILETTVVKSSGNTLNQNVAGTAGTTATVTFTDDRIQEIIDYISADGETLPTKIEPSTAWVNSILSDDLIRLDSVAQANIAQNVSAYIETQIEANKWYNFTYNAVKCERDITLIVEAAAKDTWDTGNRYSRSAGLSYYNKNLQDSSEISISGQERQTRAAITQAKTYALTYLTGVSTAVQDFAASRFEIVNTIINDPKDAPDAADVSSEGDITNSFKTNPTETTFNAATAINLGINVFTIPDHGLVNGQKVIYDINGNTNIVGLDDEQTYYIKLINVNEFSLTFDESGDFPVNIRVASTGTHKFLSGVIEFFVNEITSSHSIYQTLELESGSESYEFTPGKQITGATGSSNNSAIVFSWEPAIRELVVSVEQVAVGSSLLRIQFDATSVIAADHAGTPNTAIGVNSAAAKLGLGSATFAIKATDGSSSLSNLINLPEKQVWFHRPSIVNSSSHTWEYAGSGTDYNALPQNGGNTKAEFEQFEELPGRVYSSGTNELGDFKVGDFITAFNRTGNITFRNKVKVDELDALRLSLSDVAIEEISTSVNLGDDELGGSKNERLPTQLAVRSFISNRLGGFVDKTVSSAAVPGAIVQLNTNGQLNGDLIPATRQFTNTNTQGYLSRIAQVDNIPAIDLKAGDIGTENYEQIELTFSGNISANDGDTITQPNMFGAIGYAKGLYANSGNMLVASVTGEWIEGDDSTGSQWQTGVGNNIFVNGVDSGVYPTALGVVGAIIDNFFLRSSKSSQFLVLDPGPSYTFTANAIAAIERTSNVSTVTTTGAHNLQVGNSMRVKLLTNTTFNAVTAVLSTPSSTTFTYANADPDDVSSFNPVGATVGTVVKSADGNASGAVTETRFGVMTGVNNVAIVNGSGYTPTAGNLTYKDVAISNVSGSGSGATADITVTAGKVADIDIKTGGTGYAIGDEITVAASLIGGTGSGFKVAVSAIEKRAYVDIVGGELFVASTSSIDFVEDNSSVQNTFDINTDDQISHNFLAGDSGAGGAVTYSNDRVTIANHGYQNGDPVTYNTLGNTPIGGMLNGQVVYAKRIDNNTIELYEGFALLDKVEFSSTPANNNHNLTRFTINLTDNSVTVEGHGYVTGNAIRLNTLSDGSTSNAMFSVDAAVVADGSRYFVGSVTTNSFTLHTLRSDAISSINDLVTNAEDITATGVGTIRLTRNNVQVNGQVNTSSRLKVNWNSLAVTNIDAENIISGIISPSRLGGSGSPSTDTFLRGDSSYAVVVQKLKKSSTTDNPITITGSSISQEFYGTVSLGIANADFNAGNVFSTLGTSKFLQSQFDVNSNNSGEVFLKDGVVDAGTLDSLDSAYFLNPANLTSNVPVSRGGTNISTYARGDILYAETTGTLNPLGIGRKNGILKSTGAVPEWGTALDLAEGLDVGAAAITSSSTGGGSVYESNVTSLKIGGAATNTQIGSTAQTRNLFPFLDNYDASASQDVVANFKSVTAVTNDATANASKEVPLTDTTSVLAGMLVTGSGSIPSNTVVTGVTEDFIYLNTATTGTITSSTTLTFTYTPKTLGVSVGDSIVINGSGVTNLNGRWPVIGATANATSFTMRTDANVTASALDTPTGTQVINSNFIVRNGSLVLGSAEAAAAPTNGELNGSDAYGIDVAGGSLTISPGVGTGNATGADFVVKTGAVSTTGDIRQISTERLRIDTSGKAEFTGEVKVDATISTSETTVGLLDAVATTINMGGAATTVEIGAATGTTTIHNNVDIDLDLNVDGSDITTNQTGTFNLINTNATRLDLGGAATTINMGTGGDGGGTTTIGHDLVVQGDLTVNGSQTTINSTTLTVDDKNIVVASGAADSSAANGAGITIDGANASITWDSTNTALDSSDDFNLASGKAYYINDASVLNATTLGTAVVNSTLQVVDTLNTGTWQATIIDPTYGGTGVNNGSKTITLGGSLTHTGAHTIGLTTTATTAITLPTSGTLAIIDNPLSQFASTTSAELAGVLSDETGTGVAVFGTNPNITTSLTTASATFGLVDTNATTVNFARAATALVMGAATGTTTIQNNLNVDGDIEIDGGDLTFSDATINIANTTPTSVTFANAATTLNIGAASGTATIRNTNVVIDNGLAVNGTAIDTSTTGTFNLLKDNATTVAFAQAATTLQMGATSGTTTIRNDADIDGDLNIDGTLTIAAIDNVPIGINTPAAGGFTTLTANNFVTFTEATNATGTFASGGAAVKITGGLHVAKDVIADNFSGDASATNLTSGTIPDARVPASAITQHQLSITGTGILNAGSVNTGFGDINIGTSTFSGVGSGLTDLVATQLTSGTIPDARIQSSGVTQHQADIVEVGQVNAGSISSGFGNVNIGTSTFTGSGSGLTTLNATNLSSGTVDGARLGGNQSAAGIKTFTDTSSATSTTTGAMRIGGGLGVAGAMYAGSMYTADGSNLQALNASNLSSGTLPNTRMSGTYSNLTGTGALGAGEITSGFGNINIGTSTFTGVGSGLTSVNATTLDSIDSGSFVRSDVDDTITGLLTTSLSGEQMKFSDTSATGNPYVGFYQGSTRRAYIQFVDTGGILRLASDENNDRLDIGSGTTGLKHVVDSSSYTVWTSGNDGAGSGLDADLLDGVSSGSFMRSDANDTFTGTLSGSGTINITGNITGATISGDGSGLSGITADNANTLDNLDSTAFLRLGVGGIKTSGSLVFNDDVSCVFGTDSDVNVYVNNAAAALRFDVQNDYDILFRDSNSSNATRFTFDISSGNFTATGEITAYSDATLKDNIEIIADPLTKILSVRGVTFTRNDQNDDRVHMGVIAQEVEEYFPEVVHTNNEGIKSVNYGAMAGVFIEAFKEQQNQIDELKNIVQKLLDK